MLQHKDLIPIARLTGVTDDGFLVLKTYKNFEEDFLKTQDFFLVFKDHRVRFVTLTDMKLSKNYHIKIKEIDVLEEMTNPDEVQICMAPDDVDAITNEVDEDTPIGKDAVFKDTVIGKVTDWFDNSAHDVLVIVLKNESEIMVPDVDSYVIDETEDAVIFQNIDDFLNL